jgi:hypothetical protein
MLRFRVPSEQGPPLPGHIIMGYGPRVRRGYRVMSAVASRAAGAIGADGSASRR